MKLKVVTLKVLKAQQSGEQLPTDHWRPETRADCADIPRPCPFVGCRHNLYLDVTAAGSIQFNFSGEPEDMTWSCALDEAERGPQILTQISEKMHLTRERVRQIEEKAFQRMTYGVAVSAMDEQQTG